MLHPTSEAPDFAEELFCDIMQCPDCNGIHLQLKFRRVEVNYTVDNSPNFEYFGICPVSQGRPFKLTQKDFKNAAPHA